MRPSNSISRLFVPLLISVACSSTDLAQAQDGIPTTRNRQLRRENHALRTELRELRGQYHDVQASLRTLRSMQVRGEARTTCEPRSIVRITDVSPVPDPEASEYADCFAIAKADLLRAGRDLFPDDTPPTVLVALLVIKDRKLQRPASEFRPGDLVSAVMFRDGAVDDSARAIQRSNSIEAFDLPLVFATDVRELATERVAIEPPTPSPLSLLSGPERLAAAATAYHDRLAGFDGSWDRWMEALEPWREQLRDAVGDRADGVTWEQRITFRGLDRLTRDPRMEWPEPQIAVLSSLRDQLGQLGIDLVVVPFPTKDQITATHFLKTPVPHGVIDPDRDRLYASLLDAGIDVIDARAAMIDALGRFPHVYYDGQEGHPADGAIQTLAKLAAERVWRLDLERDFDAVTVQAVEFQVPDRFVEFPPRAFEQPTYTATVVSTADGETLPEPSTDSPILLIGDSTLDVPHRYGVDGADFRDHLAKETGIVAKQVFNSGSAPRALELLGFQRRKLFDGVRICMFVLMERYLFIHDPERGFLQWQVRTVPKLRR